jgi:hypothetical protein
VDDLRVRVNEHLEERNRASNAVSAPSRRHIVRRFTRLKPQRIFLAVHRVEFTVYYRRIEPDEFALLRAIQRERTIGAALDSIDGLTPGKVQTWFANWSQLGWLCREAQDADDTETV